MIFEVQSYRLIFQDAVYSLGVGFIVGAVYQLLSVVLYKGKIAVFIRDILICLFFTVIVFSYSISFANYKVLRWYNVMFALIGRLLFTPAFSHTAHRYLQHVSLRLKTVLKTVIISICGKLSVITEKNKEKKRKNTQKNQPEVLKPDDILLYN